MAAVAARLLAVRPRSAFGLTLFSIWVHDLLDLLQSTDRTPLWPLSNVPLGPRPPWIPSGLFAEVALFGGLALAVWLWRLGADRGKRRPIGSGMAAGLAAGIIALSAVTSHLRDRREADADGAHYLVEHGNPRLALALLDRADKWPSPSKPGRIDYLRGAAYYEMGDRDAAERYYLRSLRRDPSYFWAVLDLGVFYAESSGSSEDRRRRAMPFIERLRKDFSHEPGVDQALVGIERKLTVAVPGK